jgi:hypothetical protein
MTGLWRIVHEERLLDQLLEDSALSPQLWLKWLTIERVYDYCGGWLIFPDRLRRFRPSFGPLRPSILIVWEVWHVQWYMFDR